MNQQEAQEFLYNNDTALKILSEKLCEAANIRNCKNELDLKANKKAIEIVESWISEVFGIAMGDQIRIPTEESLYIRLVNSRNEPNNF